MNKEKRDFIFDTIYTTINSHLKWWTEIERERDKKNIMYQCIIVIIIDIRLYYSWMSHFHCQILISAPTQMQKHSYLEKKVYNPLFNSTWDETILDRLYIIAAAPTCVISPKWKYNKSWTKVEEYTKIYLPISIT